MSTNYDDIKISYTYNTVEITDASGSFIPDITDQKLTNVFKKGETFVCPVVALNFIGQFLYEDLSILIPYSSSNMDITAYNEFINKGIYISNE